MGKKNRGKKAASAYKPSFAGQARPKLDDNLQKMAEQPTKRQKKSESKAD